MRSATKILHLILLRYAASLEEERSPLVAGNGRITLTGNQHPWMHSPNHVSVRSLS